jgi:hypothetical protein
MHALACLLAATGGAQSALSPRSNATRTCMSKDYQLSNGCPGTTVTVQGCFESTAERARCTDQLGQTIEDEISFDSCYKTFDKVRGHAACGMPRLGLLSELTRRHYAALQRAQDKGEQW